MFDDFTEANTSKSLKKDEEELSPTYENTNISDQESTNISSDINKNVENANNTTATLETKSDAMEDNCNGNLQDRKYFSLIFLFFFSCLLFKIN